VADGETTDSPGAGSTHDAPPSSAAASALLRPPQAVRLAAQLACVLEASAPKPGNVTPAAGFADLTYGELVACGVAIGPGLEAAGDRGVGATVLEAVRATRPHASGNPSLGIVLLLAPLARAALLELPAPDLRGRLRAVLAALDVQDARDAFAAIRLAGPGGLGEASEHDVREVPSVSLLEAMRAAADRDAIAAEYASGYAASFEIGLPVLTAAAAAGVPILDAIVEVHLALLAAAGDTLIARKCGPAASLDARDRARAVLTAGGTRSPAGRAALARLDEALRRDGHRHNPGATADLVAAVLFIALLTGAIGAGPPRA